MPSINRWLYERGWVDDQSLHSKHVRKKPTNNLNFWKLLSQTSLMELQSIKDFIFLLIVKSLGSGKLDNLC